MRKIVLTGATGLIGAELLSQLDTNYEVHAVSRYRNITESNNIQWHSINLADNLDSSKLPENVDAVIYLAQSENFRSFPCKAVDVFQVNTAKMLEFLDYGRHAGAKTFIYASSGGVYGVGGEGFSEEIALPANGENGFYLSTKLCAEMLLENYSQYMNIIILRFFFVYGKNQKRTMLIPRLVDNIKTGNPIALQGPTGILINPLHVSDAVAAIIAALDTQGFHKINVAGPEVLSIRQISNIIGDIVGSKPSFKFEENKRSGNIIGIIEKMQRYLISPKCYPADGLKEMVEQD